MGWLGGSYRDNCLERTLSLERQGTVLFYDSVLTEGFFLKCSSHWTISQNFRVSPGSLKQFMVREEEKVRPISNTEL